jgi:hypothetical protein
LRPHLKKIIRAKRAGDVVQVIEHLLNKCPALSSKPNTAITTIKPVSLLNFIGWQELTRADNHEKTLQA